MISLLPLTAIMRWQLPRAFLQNPAWQSFTQNLRDAAREKAEVCTCLVSKKDFLAVTALLALKSEQVQDWRLLKNIRVQKMQSCAFLVMALPGRTFCTKHLTWPCFGSCP